MATQDTPWADAFETIYQTVASAYALPQGKNRLHKFKEKMVELWCAMQGEVRLRCSMHFPRCSCDRSKALLVF